MHFEGAVDINTSREEVWRFLTDPHAVGQCAPGVESLEVITPDQKFRVVASVGFGAVKAIFNTDVEWLELDQPNRAQMKAHGTAPGSAVDVTAGMTLVDSSGADGDQSTRLQWTADVTILGTIASLASRMMGSVTRKLTAAFFDCVKDKIEHETTSI